MTAPAGRSDIPPARDEVCGPCRIGEHVYCDGNVDLPSPVVGGIPVPLQRCACRCPRTR
jgi:hypothetical protein